MLDIRSDQVQLLDRGQWNSGAFTLAALDDLACFRPKSMRYRLSGEAAAIIINKQERRA